MRYNLETNLDVSYFSILMIRSSTEDELKTNWRNSPTWDFLVSRSPRQRDTAEAGLECEQEKCRRHSGEGEPGGPGSSESETDHISPEDRRRIIETERLLTQQEGQAGGSRRQSRRRRKLPEIPKDKKRRITHNSCLHPPFYLLSCSPGRCDSLNI